MDAEVARVKSVYKGRPFVQVYGMEGFSRTLKTVMGVPVVYGSPLFELVEFEYGPSYLKDQTVLEMMNSMCRSKFDSIENVFDYVELVFILYDPQPQGFALVTHENNDFYVQFICTNPNKKGYGTLMLDYILSAASGYTGVKKIRLQAMNDVIDFYKKNAFEVVEPGPTSTEMVRPLRGGFRKRTRRATRRKQTRRTRVTG